MKYRKKPVVIDAFQYDGDLMNRDGEFYVPDWAIEAFKSEIMYYGDDDPWEMYIRTLEGNHHVSVGDYIIQGTKGELYPCKPDIFERTYEPIESTNNECNYSVEELSAALEEFEDNAYHPSLKPDVSNWAKTVATVVLKERLEYLTKLKFLIRE